MGPLTSHHLLAYLPVPSPVLHRLDTCCFHQCEFPTGSVPALRIFYVPHGESPDAPSAISVWYAARPCLGLPKCWPCKNVNRGAATLPRADGQDYPSGTNPDKGRKRRFSLAWLVFAGGWASSLDRSRALSSGARTMRFLPLESHLLRAVTVRQSVSLHT